MLLAIDVGNTNIVFALCYGNQVVHKWRCQTDSQQSVKSYKIWMKQQFDKENLHANQISKIIVCSVVPEIDSNLKEACFELMNVDPILIDNKIAKIPLTLVNIEEIGADRIVNAYGLMYQNKFPGVVIDFGTATTFDIVNAKGEFIGGIIAPGVHLALDSLHKATAKLPKININIPEKVIGNNTVSAMESGIYWGYVSMIEGLLMRIEMELGIKPYSVATGGLSCLFADRMDVIDYVDKDWTIKGLMQLSNQLVSNHSS